MDKFTNKILIIAANLIFLILPIKVTADFRCTSEVGYKWQQISDAQPAPAPVLHNKPGQAKEEPNAEPPAASPDLQTIVSVIDKKAATEELAKQLVEEQVASAKFKADKLCARQREDTAGCISNKYNSLLSKSSGLSFSARKGIEEAAKTDCRRLQGKCTGAFASEVKCAEIKAEIKAEPTAEPAKDAKGKKK